MENRSDFLISTDVIVAAKEAIDKLMPLYTETIAKIRSASEELIDKSNWSGDAREEFKATYRIVEHYLEDDSDRVSSISEMLEGFQEIYETLDIDSAKKVYETVSGAVSGDKEKSEAKV